MGRTSGVKRAARMASVVAERREAIAEMSAPLRNLCQELQTELLDHSESNLKFYHNLGKKCLELKEHPKKYLTAEQVAARVDPFALLERAVSTARETFRKAIAFVTAYDAAGLKRLFAYRNEADPRYRLHWGHVLYLLSVDTEPLRIQLEQRAVNGLWDPKRLLKAIQKHYGVARSKGGRPWAIPKTVLGQVEQIVDMTTHWLGRHEAVWNGEKHSVYANVLSIPPEKLTPEILSKLQAIRDKMAQVEVAADAEAKACSRVIEVVTQALKQNGSATVLNKAAAVSKKLQQGLGVRVAPRKAVAR